MDGSAPWKMCTFRCINHKLVEQSLPQLRSPSTPLYASLSPRMRESVCVATPTCNLSRTGQRVAPGTGPDTQDTAVGAAANSALRVRPRPHLSPSQNTHEYNARAGEKAEQQGHKPWIFFVAILCRDTGLMGRCGTGFHLQTPPYSKYQ